MGRTASWGLGIAAGCAIAAGCGDGGGASEDAATSPADAGVNADAASAELGSDVPGNRSGTCTQALPSEARAVDVSKPAHVVGSGSAASCTEAALRAAAAEGGIIAFDCGAGPVRITLGATLDLPVDRDVVIDGGGKVTLDGGGKVRVLRWDSPDWQSNPHTLTLQHLTIAHGKASGTERIPSAPAPCSQGYNDGQGGALFMRDGALRAIEVSFLDNRAAELGPDTGGGALYLLGSRPAYVVRCTFKGNQASNAGAMGSLFTTDFIYDSVFDQNAAVGSGANNDDATMCDAINNGQHEVGSGGNGGAIYSDGVGMDITLCGNVLSNNKSGAFGAALFFTSNDPARKGTLTIRDTHAFGNVPTNDWWEWQPGFATNANTVDPIDSQLTR